MKKLIKGQVLSNIEISDNIYEMVVKVDSIVKEVVAGQFCSIYVNSKELLLPRPISICDINIIDETVTFVYAVVGQGTKAFTLLTSGDIIDILMPLGNGFTIFENKKNIAVIGGGVGIPPLYLLAKNIMQKTPNANITVILGYRDKPFLLDKFKDFNVKIATDSGKYGVHGNTVTILKDETEDFDMIYACGPKGMLVGVSDFANSKNIQCEISMEERMACSIGACVGCVTKIRKDYTTSNMTQNEVEYKKVCVDGPVFNSLEVVFGE